MGDVDFVESRLDELDSILVEWDERFADVDIDADEVALAQADALLDEYDPKVLVLRADPRALAVLAAQAARERPGTALAGAPSPRPRDAEVQQPEPDEGKEVSDERGQPARPPRPHGERLRSESAACWQSF